MPHETILLQGHIIDSLLLPKVLDLILQFGGTFELADIRIGKTRQESSFARIVIHGDSASRLEQILAEVQAHGAALEAQADCAWRPAPADGVLPEDFYATTNLPTEARCGGRWIPVSGIEMDLAIRLHGDPSEPSGEMTAATIPMADVRKGDRIVVGRDGIRVMPLERPAKLDAFGFMESTVSSERPHGHIVADVARRMLQLREGHGKVLLAGGPAIIHGGGREALAWLVDSGFIHVLFCGNALAAHDMEVQLYGTSLGFRLKSGGTAHHGHEHHLRTINRIRAIGSIEAAVQAGVITEGIMAACVRRNVKVVMAGTIRDDGPLPEVITDSVEAQAAMREAVRDVGLALLVASTLHAVATGNLLPAAVPTVCVDINPAVPTKLADRGSFQAASLVMDAASFLRELAIELGWKK
jgi:lysine-ketoglutarate reductase/saccharopine dehydrogenase-like protein (TIGR00300 family)